ncbi:MAG TPA: helicase-related protein [Gemmatimonadaceae bacterium]|nr:helicase-related protein [Gemmatimonadaceae bacterium]
MAVAEYTPDLVELLADPGPIVETPRTERADDDVAPLALALVASRFEAEEREAYDRCADVLAEARVQLVSQYNVEPHPLGEFARQVDELANEELGRASMVARRFLTAASERASLLAESPAKMAALRKVAPAIVAAERTVVCTRTADSAQLVREVLRRCGLLVEVLHDGLAADERQRIVDDLRSGALKVVVTPQELGEEIDLPPADLAIVVASIAPRRRMIRRLARVLRRPSDGRLARLVVLTIEGTIEDPQVELHEGVLDTLMAIAERVERFEPDASTAAVCTALLDAVAPPRAATATVGVPRRVRRALAGRRAAPWRQDRALESTVRLVRERTTPFSREEAALIRPRLEHAARIFRDTAHRVHAVDARKYVESAIVCEEALGMLDLLDPETITRARAAAAEARDRELTRLRDEIEEARRAVAAQSPDDDGLDAAVLRLRALRPEEWRAVADAWQQADQRAINHNLAHARNALGGMSAPLVMSVHAAAAGLARRVRQLSPDLFVMSPSESYLMGVVARSHIESWRSAVMTAPVTTVLESRD